MRRGFTVLEVIVACGLLAVLMTLCIQVLSLVAVERRHVERRAIALQQAANLLEQATAIPYDEVDDERLAKLELSPDAGKLLPGGKATLHAADETGDLPGKRILVEVEWTGPAGRREPPVRLTSWLWAEPTGAAP